MKKKNDNSHNETESPSALEDIEGIGQWLEIDGDTIVGVHSHQCHSELKWIKYEGDDEARIGFQWNNNKIVKPKIEINDEQLRQAARQHITETYPLWRQLNILREGDQKKIENMSKFIDASRTWSNDSKAKMSNLKKVKP